MCAHPNYPRKDMFMRILRSVTAILLLLSLLFSVVACGGYRAVKSSDEELATALTLGGDLAIPYEMYRFYFLSELALADKDPASLAPEEKQSLFDELHNAALDEMAQLYAVARLCSAYGIDIQSDAFDDVVETEMKSLYEEQDSDKETYLAYLKEHNMNDSVCRTLIRMNHAEKVLGEHLRDKGIIKSDSITVQNYIKSDACIRVTWIYVSYASAQSFADRELEVIASEASHASNEEFLRMTHNVLPDTYTDEELETGFYIGSYQLDPYYKELTEAAFSLEVGETTDWVRSGDGMYIVRRLEKDNEYINDLNNLGDFTEYYLLNEYYKMLAEEADRLLTSVQYSEIFSTFSLDTVKMPK